MIEKLNGLMPAAPNPRDPARIRDAAQQFESLLVAQMLKTAREANGGGWMGGGEDQTAESAMGYAEEQLAQSISAQGGLGLTRTIVDGLTKASSSADARTAAPRPPQPPKPALRP
jgi:flagellar protein FlgJ